MCEKTRRLAEINTAVPIDFTFDEMRLQEPDYDALISMYTKLEFNSFLKKLNLAARTHSEPEGESVPGESRMPSAEDDLRPTVCIETMDAFEAMCCELEADPHAVLKVYSDGNHQDRPTLDGISLLTKKACYYIDGAAEELLEALRLFACTHTLKLSGHQIQDDYYALICSGWTDWMPETEFDTALGQYLLEPGRSHYDLDTLVKEYFHEEMGEEPVDSDADSGTQIGLFDPAASDAKKSFEKEGAVWCRSVEAVRACLLPRLEEANLIRVLNEVELPLAFVLADMESEGVSVDPEVLKEIGARLKEKLDELTGRIYELAGESFNINSPKQLGRILFEKLGLQAGKKTKTKSGYSTNAETLERLRGDHEIVELVLDYRMLSKLNGTYIEGLLPLIHKDGRIHAHFQQTVTATGRISCTEPNLQNIPIRQEQGRAIRKAFVPQSEEWTLVGADYSQIELRVLAHMSGDPALIRAFNQRQDIHRATAAQVFGLSEEDVTPLQRSRAKAVNFGVIYGMSGFRLSSELQISRNDAEAYIAEYFRRYPNVKTFMDEMVERGKTDGYAETILGRRRPIPEIQASNYTVRQLGERLAMNSPIQGSAADLIKLAMIGCHRELRKRGLRSRLILQIHDELIVRTHKDELEEVRTLLRETMEQAMPLDVELSVDLNSGDSWYDLK